MQEILTLFNILIIAFFELIVILVLFDVLVLMLFNSNIQNLKYFFEIFF